MARPINLADVLEAIADHVPERVALITNSGPDTYAEHTFAELDARASRLANHLASVGIGRGDHVGIQSGNRIEWIETFFGCFKIGAIPINVNHRYVKAELEYLYENSECVAAVVAREYRAVVDDVRTGLPGLRHVLELGQDYEDALAAVPADRPAVQRSGDDGYVLYTGGTTGMPKGVIWRQEDIILAALNASRGNMPIRSADQLGEEARDKTFVMRLMGMGPMMHGGAQWTMGNALVSGCTYVMYTLPSFDAHEVWTLAERAKTNTISTIGDAMARPLAEALATGSHTYDLSNLFAIGNGGAPLTAAVKAQLRAVLPNVIINDSYGASETGAAGSRPDDGSAGAPKFNVGADTTVLDDRGQVCAVGEVGKLARSGHIPLGYHRDPVKTAATFPTVDGKRWVIPGDDARIEADGTISVLGRGSVSINSGGEKIHPEEVEAALKSHPAVYDAAVIGTPSERWGEQVTALVARREGAGVSTAQLVAHVRTLVADYKSPKAVLFVDQIGRTPVAKVDYQWAKREALHLLGLDPQGT